MIVFDLSCGGGHRFEGWFGSSGDFADQQQRGLVACPECGSADVTKAVMAPNVGRKANQIAERAPAAKRQPMSREPLPPEAARLMQKLAEYQVDALRTSRWVGDNFAEDARAMHYGERDAESIHGQTTLDEARELLEEGIQVAPLPFPVAPPDKAN